MHRLAGGPMVRRAKGLGDEREQQFKGFRAAGTRPSVPA